MRAKTGNIELNFTMKINGGNQMFKKTKLENGVKISKKLKWNEQAKHSAEIIGAKKIIPIYVVF